MQTFLTLKVLRHSRAAAARPQQRSASRHARVVCVLWALLLTAGCRGAVDTATVTTATGVPTPIATALAPPTDTPQAMAAPESPLSPLAAAAVTTPAVAPPQNFTYQVNETFPHDPGAFTQGLIIQGDRFYEGTGLRGQSTLRLVDVATGEVLQGVRLPDQLFGEGITEFNDKIYQLTWQSQIGLIYDKESFELLGTFTYPTEGWGLTHDGQALIMSDGSATLTYLDPATLAAIRKVEVVDDQGPVVRLNELEYIDGRIYANVWQTDRIVIIDPATGHVTGDIDLTGILPANQVTGQVDVLNGIAYDPDQDAIFVTGKLWPLIFEIDLVPIEE